MKGVQDKTSLSLELQLICACARTDIRSSHVTRIQSLVKQQLDWQQFLLLSHQHRVMPLIFRALGTARVLDSNSSVAVPDSIRVRFEQHFYDNLGRNLYLVDKLTHILKLMAASGIAVIPFKGATLATGVYGDLGLRQFGDLDLLILQQDVPRTEQVLIEASYRPLKLYSNEWNFENYNGNVKVDLHWGIYRDKYCHINPASWWGRCQVETLFDTSMSLFAPEELLLVLCMNATKAYWDQSLRSICDIAELINRYPRLDWDRVASEAAKLRIEKMFLAGLWLAEDFLGARLPSDFTQTACPFWRNVDSLVEKLKENLLTQPTDRPSHNAILNWDFQKMDRWQDRAYFLWRVNSAKLVPNKRDRAFLPLPNAISFLHYLIRPIRLVVDFCLKRRID